MAGGKTDERPARRSTGTPERGSVCGDDGEDAVAVGLALLGADAGDAIEVGQRGRAGRGERSQRRIAEHDVGGHTLLARLFGTPYPQRLAQAPVRRTPPRPRPAPPRGGKEGVI